MGEENLIYTVSKRWCVTSRLKWQTSISWMKLGPCVLWWSAGWGSMWGCFKTSRVMTSPAVTVFLRVSPDHWTEPFQAQTLATRETNWVSQTFPHSRGEQCATGSRWYWSPEPSYRNMASHSTSVLAFCLHCWHSLQAGECARTCSSWLSLP